MSDQAQWLDKIGKCMSCSKPAAGQLMSTSNYKLGPYCEQCARNRIAAAKAERAKEPKEKEPF